MGFLKTRIQVSSIANGFFCFSSKLKFQGQLILHGLNGSREVCPELCHRKRKVQKDFGKKRKCPMPMVFGRNTIGWKQINQGI